MVLVPETCNSVAGTEADGVNVRFPAVIADPVVMAVPLMVIPVMAALQAGSSVNVTLNGLSTVAPTAAIRVGGVLVTTGVPNTVKLSIRPVPPVPTVPLPIEVVLLSVILK